MFFQMNLAPGSQFSRNKFGLSFGFKNRLRLHFDSERCLNYPFWNGFLVKGISSQNSSGFSSRNSSQFFFLLNWAPDGCRGRAAGILQERRRHRLGHWVGIHPRTVGPVCSGETGQFHRRHAEKAGRSQGGDLIEKIWHEFRLEKRTEIPFVF